jgi:P27 family predicted phage terminase small subunit
MLKLTGSKVIASRKAEPSADPTMPKAPDWVTGDALELWEAVGPKLNSMRVLSSADATSFARYCVIYSKWREAERMVREEGEVVTGALGGPIRNPWAVALKQYADQMLRLEQEFGLTPSARSRITVKGGNGDSSLQEFIGRGRTVG